MSGEILTHKSERQSSRRHRSDLRHWLGGHGADGANRCIRDQRRSVSRTQYPRRNIGESGGSSARVEFLLADLASQGQVRRLAEDIKRTLTDVGFDRLDSLVNNAGVYMIPKILTENGIENTFAVDHLAGFLLTHELLGWLQRAHGRVLTTSSYSHRTTPLCLARITNPWPHIGLIAYKRAKLCNVLFTYELNRRYSDLTAFAVDPGLVNTEITSKGGRGIESWIWQRKELNGTTVDVPARTFLYLSGEEHGDVSQGYYFMDCAPLRPSRQSQQDLPVDRLWALSCELVGVEW